MTIIIIIWVATTITKIIRKKKKGHGRKETLFFFFFFGERVNEKLSQKNIMRIHRSSTERHDKGFSPPKIKKKKNHQVPRQCLSRVKQLNSYVLCCIIILLCHTAETYFWYFFEIGAWEIMIFITVGIKNVPSKIFRYRSSYIPQ